MPAYLRLGRIPYLVRITIVATVLAIRGVRTTIVATVAIRAVRFAATVAIRGVLIRREVRLGLVAQLKRYYTGSHSAGEGEAGWCAQETEKDFCPRRPPGPRCWRWRPSCAGLR